MHRRRLLAALAVVALAVTAGCIGQFGVGISDEELASEPPAEYEWGPNATVDIDLHAGGLLGGSEYTAVYTGNETELTLSTRGFTRSHSVDVRAVRFRYPNGTVVGHEHVEVEQTARETTIRLPTEDGELAYTGDRRTRELRAPAIDDGTYRVTLPEGYRVGDFLLSDVTPRAYETERADDTVTIVWSDITAGDILLVRYYRDRDRYLFWGVIVLLLGVGIGVYAYFNREIEAIQEWREDQGLDVDDEDEGDRPPPGMG